MRRSYLYFMFLLGASDNPMQMFHHKTDYSLLKRMHAYKRRPFHQIAHLTEGCQAAAPDGR